MTRFSVIIPAYKVRYLGEAIESVLNQDYQDYELIVFDDASPEPVPGIVKAFSDQRIRYQRSLRNLGVLDPTRSWNAALSLAQGEFVNLLGDDDLIDRNFLSEMDALIGRQPGADIYRSRLRRIDENGSPLAYGFPLSERESWDEFVYFRNTGLRSHSTVEMCLRTSALREIGGWVAMPVAIGSDDLTYVALAARSMIASTNTTCASWRTHRRQISRSRRLEGQRLRAFTMLGAAEKDFIESNKAHTIPRDLLLQKLPGSESRPLKDRVRSWLAMVAGSLGIE